MRQATKKKKTPIRPNRIGLTMILAFASAPLLSACVQNDESQAEPATIEEQPAQTPIRQLAFPGAEGYGRFAKGGRGGEILFVTTLADTGRGSLRACIEAEGPRVCVFRVSGTIRFEKERPIIFNPYLTIAGETAPGDGILLTHSGGEDGLTPLVVKNSHDVVVRHIRVRTDRAGKNRGSNDSFTIENSERVIFDHVSGSWALDEVYNGHSNNNDLTISRSIFAEGLKDHDKCALLVSDPETTQRISFIRNLCAHNGDRNPDINARPGSCIEIVNNVFYNAAYEFAEVWESYGGTSVSIVGNHFRAGPSTASGIPAIGRNTIGSTGAAEIYIDDNLIDGEIQMVSERARPFLVDEPACPLTIDPLPSSEVLNDVLNQSGARPLDSVDLRIIDDVKNRTGAIVDKPGEMPILAPGPIVRDRDYDGMPDEWEFEQGMDSTNYNPWDDDDGDGWANLEEYLDYAHQQRLVQSE
jgi:hypothetical protein